MPHADFGEAVVAVLALGAGTALGAAEIDTALKGRLAGFKRPKAVHIVNALPRNAMGKVEKAQLREDYTRTFDVRE